MRILQNPKWREDPNNNSDIKQDSLFNRQNMVGLLARSLSDCSVCMSQCVESGMDQSMNLIKLNVAFQPLPTTA